MLNFEKLEITVQVSSTNCELSAIKKKKKKKKNTVCSGQLDGSWQHMFILKLKIKRTD